MTSHVRLFIGEKGQKQKQGKGFYPLFPSGGGGGQREPIDAVPEGEVETNEVMDGWGWRECGVHELGVETLGAQ